MVDSHRQVLSISLKFHGFDAPLSQSETLYFGAVRAAHVNFTPLALIRHVEDEMALIV
jgi:hypothetical protein